MHLLDVHGIFGICWWICIKNYYQ